LCSSWRSTKITPLHQVLSLGTFFLIQNAPLDAEQRPHIGAHKFSNIESSHALQIAPARLAQVPEAQLRYIKASQRLGAPQSSGGPLNYLSHILRARNHFCGPAVNITKPSSDTNSLILERDPVTRSSATPWQSDAVSRPRPNCPKKWLSPNAPLPESKTS
jgi:hypothetical protein